MDLATSSVGGKTARACDCCVRRRARWYCAADDAFLCQSCDSSVHSANPLARRHQRIRLKTASSVGGGTEDSSLACDMTTPTPTWVKGCKRKARTPRPTGANKFSLVKVQPLVPDLVETSSSLEDGFLEDQMLYHVPDSDPLITKFCSAPVEAYDSKQTLGELTVPVSLAGFVPSETELEEFTADMESLLNDGREEAFCIEKLGLVEPMDFATLEQRESGKEEEEEELVEVDFDVSKETIELGVDWESPEEEVEELKFGDEYTEEKKVDAKKAKLSLDYEAVIAASSSQGLFPWTDGQRPHISLDDNSWPDHMGMWIGGAQVQGEKGGVVGDGEREARVSRYREKRRMRLFSKKIRYEVRKLNAEKRPRMKGRFVKRTPGVALAH